MLEIFLRVECLTEFYQFLFGWFSIVMEGKYQLVKFWLKRKKVWFSAVSALERVLSMFSLCQINSLQIKNQRFFPRCIRLLLLWKVCYLKDHSEDTVATKSMLFAIKTTAAGTSLKGRLWQFWSTSEIKSIGGLENWEKKRFKWKQWAVFEKQSSKLGLEQTSQVTAFVAQRLVECSPHLTCSGPIRFIMGQDISLEKSFCCVRDFVMGQMFAIHPSPLRICKNTSASWEHKALITLLMERGIRRDAESRSNYSWENILIRVNDFLQKGAVPERLVASRTKILTPLQFFSSEIDHTRQPIITCFMPSVSYGQLK